MISLDVILDFCQMIIAVLSGTEYYYVVLKLNHQVCF